MSRVLLLEPNKLLLKNIRDFLKIKGFEVSACDNAQAGINAADNKKTDIVVVELLLSGHSGVEFLYEFRSYDEWSNVPAIIFTSLHRGELNLPDERLKELGVVMVLDKSKSSLDKLVTRINRTLEAA